MSKKDFELAAQQIAELPSWQERSCVRNYFVKFFEAKDSRFDKNRFFDKIALYVWMRLRVENTQ